jgi:nucleoid-associated protein YgaU
MTSDAKLGLLLGLGLVCAIVFAVNGLPGLIFKNVTNPLISDGSQVIRKPSEDIMALARNAARNLSESQQGQVEYKQIEQENIKHTTIPSYAMETPNRVNVIEQLASGPVNTYTVMPNDNLAIIAKKHYGPEEGNRLVNIEKIAKFNGFSSSNFIRQGQKLKIPPLELAENPNFVAAKTITPKRKISNVRNVIALPQVSVVSRTSKKYTIREGDTLWSIAKRFLGDGLRYDEICKANKISEGESLSVGMSLVIPK